MPDRQSRVTSSHWGAFRVITEKGRITAVEPFEADTDPSGIPSSLPAAVHHATRVARPAIRRGWLESPPQQLLSVLVPFL